MTQRRWRSIGGVTSPADVQTLQTSVKEYHSTLLPLVLAASGANKLAPAPDPKGFSIVDWQSVDSAVADFLAEDFGTGGSDLNPLDYLSAGGAYDRGRALVTRLDTWRDKLAALGIANVPAALPVPNTSTDLLGSTTTILVLVAAVLLLKD